MSCARLHARHLVWEWGLNGLADSTELFVSELVTNAVKAIAGQEDQAAGPARAWPSPWARGVVPAAVDEVLDDGAGVGGGRPGDADLAGADRLRRW
jgi:hypothetical protein